MSQATLPFDPLAAAPARPLARRATAPVRDDHDSLDGAGFAIGWEHARYRTTPPLAHLHADNPVRQGWAAGRAAFGARTLRPTTAVRRWLRLRLQAWQQGQAFETVQVTPHFLAQIDAAVCPVSRVALAADTGDEVPAAAGPTAAVARVHAGAAYAAGNLALLSDRVCCSRGASDFAALQARLRRLEDEHLSELDGLDADSWARLATLVGFVTPLPHAQAALLPLRVLPPNRLRVLNPVQALQVMLTLQFTEAGYARRLVGLAALMPNTEVRQAFQVFMHTLLARRLEAERLGDGLALRQAMEDSWADPLVLRRWQRLALRLSATDCEQLLQRAARRGLSLQSSRWVGLDEATEGWALETAGRAPLQPQQAGPQSAAPAAH